jgi:hypothetical protein
MSNNDWKTRHVRVPCFFTDDGWERGGLTLRYKLVGGELSYKYSICSPQDQYSRELGISVAEFGEVSIISNMVNDSDKASDIEIAILMDIVDNTRDTLSKSTLNLIYAFVRNGTNRELTQFFYPKKGNGND